MSVEFLEVEKDGGHAENAAEEHHEITEIGQIDEAEGGHLDQAANERQTEDDGRDGREDDVGGVLSETVAQVLRVSRCQLLHHHPVVAVADLARVQSLAGLHPLHQARLVHVSATATTLTWRQQPTLAVRLEAYAAIVASRYRN